MTESQIFRIGRATVRLRHRNTAIGLVLAVVLAWIIWSIRSSIDNAYQRMLMGAALLTLAVLGLVHLTGYLRYLTRSRAHHLEVGATGLVFTTGDERSELEEQEILMIKREKHLGEEVSLMIKLRNGRVVRLQGYERQEELMDLVIGRFGTPSPP